MKKYLLFALIFVVVLSLCACGGRKTEQTEPTTNPTTTPPTVITPPSTNATLDPTIDNDLLPDMDNSTNPSGANNDISARRSMLFR